MELLEPLIATKLKQSMTRIPVVVKTSEGHVIIDTPGFGDTEGTVQEIANAFYNYRILQVVD